MKGHTPTYHKSGPNDSYWNVRCSCGWATKPSFRVRKREVTTAFRHHIEDVKKQEVPNG